MIRVTCASGTRIYLPALRGVVSQCGLTWDDDVVNEVFDQTCVHHVPAAIVHESQELFDAMVARPRLADPVKNRAQLDRDSRAIEEMRLREWQANQERIAELEEAERRSRQTERHLDLALARLAESARLFEETTEALSAMQAKLIASQEREIRSWEQNEQLRDRLERIESHPIIGAALRGRRRLRGLMSAIASNHTHGHSSPTTVTSTSGQLSHLRMGCHALPMIPTCHKAVCHESRVSGSSRVILSIDLLEEPACARRQLRDSPAPMPRSAARPSRRHKG